MKQNVMKLKNRLDNSMLSRNIFLIIIYTSISMDSSLNFWIKTFKYSLLFSCDRFSGFAAATGTGAGGGTGTRARAGAVAESGAVVGVGTGTGIGAWASI